MPYYKKKYYKKGYFKRSYYKKKAYRKKFSKSLSLAQVSGNGKRFFKLRAVLDLGAAVGGEIISSVQNTPSGITDFTSIANLFDVYRVCATKIKFIPQLPNDTSTITGFFPLYVFMDPDNISIPVSSVNQAIEYENMRVKNMYRPWKYYVKWPKITQTNFSTTTFAGGYQDCDVLTATSAIFMYGTGFDAGQNYGKLIITHYVCAKSRK